MPEIVWDGKYDADGRRVPPLQVPLPFQTVETVNESAQQRQTSLDLFSTRHLSEWRDRLIWGDKKYVLPSLMPELGGKVNLVYIDPPFASGQDFSFPVRLNGDEFVKEPSMIEVKAYRDTWGKGLDSYVTWLSEAIELIYKLLAQNGVLCLHLDWHVGHYAKGLLDDVFGIDHYISEVVWRRTSSHNDPGRPGNVHDTLFFYAKSQSWTWNQQYQPLDPEYVEKVYVYEDQKGRYRLGDLTAPGVSRGITGKSWRGVNPSSFGRHWRRPPAELEEILLQGGIQLKTNGVPSINGWKQYLADSKGMPLQSIWDDIPNVTGISNEKLGYSTQKPEKLLSRIINAFSNPGDLVLDCFCGSGTTAAVAEKLGRRWVVADLSRFAVHTTRKRMLSVDGVRPFVVQNLGKYERQLWQSAEFGADAQDRALAYREFILDVYKAKPLEGHSWLHGVRQGRMVHVGTVDSPVTVNDIKQIAAEFRKSIGTGSEAPTSRSIDVLGWDFGFELNEVAKQTAERAGLDVRFLRIPREILDKRAVEQGDIKFFELAALDVQTHRSGRKVDVALCNFVIPTDDVPEEVQKGITDWSQWIDYWAVDWDNRGDAFHNEWQAYRTKKEPTLTKSVSHEYVSAGSYQLVVKVIDILGNDTTKTVKVEVT